MNAARFALLSLLVLALTGCAVLDKGGDVLTAEKVTQIKESPVYKTAKALRSSFADITEEEEYYIGRSVSALILSKYPAYTNKALTQYVNTVGAAVAAYSDRPEIYAGYHVLILDAEEVNALAAPGGFIFITKGLLRDCQDEEMLAAVLAHEVGHVAGKHGLQAIKKSRLMDAFKVMAAAAADKYSPQQLSQLTDLFEGALSDIAETLVERGYDRKLEYEADSLSMKFASATRYDPNGLAGFLQVLAGRSDTSGAQGWFRTHPTPEQRLEKVQKQIEGLAARPAVEKTRTTRFRQSMAGLK